MSFDGKTLELDKILVKISQYAHSPKAKNDILELKPFNNYDEIKRLLEETEDARKYIVKYSSITFDGLVDQDQLCKRISLNAYLSVKDFINLRDLLQCVNETIYYFRNNKVEFENHLLPYYEQLLSLPNLLAKINRVFDVDGTIFDNASDELYLIRKKIKTLDVKLHAKMNELLQTKAKMLNESLVVIRNGKMCLCVKNEFKNVLKGIIHDESSSKTTVYIEPYVALEISSDIEKAKEDEKKEIKRILEALSISTWDNSNDINNDYNTLVSLDTIFAKAKYAIDIEAIKPSINQNGFVILKGAKHPLIDQNKCVPIDIEIGKSYEAIIITGPNTGGKTVALKTCGLLTLMCQCGILIPAKEETNINIFDNVFADIGDEQSIEQSLSSFSGHMKNVIRIVDQLTPNSLVLFDELGSGTDPKEGSNLATSIVEYLLKHKSLVIVTTHYSDLKAFAYDNENVINASVEFNPNTLMPTYKLLLGVPGRSNAFSISKQLGLKEEIVENAKDLNEKSHNDLSKMLAKLDEKNALLEKEIKDNEEQNIILKEEIEKYRLKEEKLNNEYNLYLIKAEKEAQEIINKAKDDANKLLEELNQIKNKSDVKEHEIAELKYKAKMLDIVSEDNNVTDLKVGDFVFIKSWQQTGKITKIHKDKYYVSVGKFEMPFSQSELQIEKSATPTAKPKSKRIISNESNSLKVKKEGKLECDLRGYRYEEVAPELDRFIDQAYLAGFSQVYIIHGFGTGAVRKACYDYLKKCPHVIKTRFGGEGEGLNGVTVVYLK